MSVEHLGGGGPFNNPYSMTVRAGDFVFISGQVGLRDGKLVEGGIEAETRRCLERLGEALALAGATYRDVVKTTIFIAAGSEFAAFNRIYAEFFPENPPARSTVIAQMVVGAKVEVEAVAYVPGND